MPKSEFKQRSYVINKLENKTSPLADFVSTKPMTKICHDKTRFYCTKASDKAFLRQNQDFVVIELETNFITTNPDFIAIELATNSIMTNPDFIATELATNSIATKQDFVV